jgi:hypothetical protein
MEVTWRMAKRARLGERMTQIQTFFWHSITAALQQLSHSISRRRRCIDASISTSTADHKNVHGMVALHH